MDLVRKAFEPDHFREMGHQLVDRLSDYLETLSENPAAMPVLPWKEPDELSREYQLRDTGLPDLLGKVLADSIHVHHPAYVGHQVCPPAPLAALVSTMVDLLNNGMGVYEMGPAANALERQLIIQVAGTLGFDDRAGGVLTSGGSLANLTALLTARSLRADSRVWSEGHAEPLSLLVSEQAHYCVERAVRIMGWGEQGVIQVPVDSRYRMRTDLLGEYLDRARQSGRKVIAVVGSACSTATGSFDDLDAIARFCRKENLWFHVDGAHGAALAFSRRHRTVLRGMEQADSVAMDFHKMLLTPALTTALVYRDGQHAFATFHQKAEYLWSRQEAPEWYNAAKRTFECTKLMMGLKPYALLNTYGPALFEQYIDRVMELTGLFAGLISDTPDFELALNPQCNILCFRYRPAGLAPEARNNLNDAIRREIIESGLFYLVQTRLGEDTWLRCTITHPFTQEKHFRELLDLIRAKALERSAVNTR